jgi:hypothetical protein
MRALHVTDHPPLLSRAAPTLLVRLFLSSPRARRRCAVRVRACVWPCLLRMWPAPALMGAAAPARRRDGAALPGRRRRETACGQARFVSPHFQHTMQSFESSRRHPHGRARRPHPRVPVPCYFRHPAAAAPPGRTLTRGCRGAPAQPDAAFRFARSRAGRWLAAHRKYGFERLAVTQFLHIHEQHTRISIKQRVRFAGCA